MYMYIDYYDYVGLLRHKRISHKPCLPYIGLQTSHHTSSLCCHLHCPHLNPSPWHPLPPLLVPARPPLHSKKRSKNSFAKPWAQSLNSLTLTLTLT